MEKLIITPRTKIHDLLAAYPELEDVLIEAAPEFKRLKNPVLRKTIARVTTLSQAAIVGHLNVEELVNRLREKAGQSHLEISEEGARFVTARQGWFREEAVIHTINIHEMLNRGEQPVHEVLSSIKKAEGDGIVEIVTSFLPAPLIDKTLSLGYKHWINKLSDQEYRVYFRK